MIKYTHPGIVERRKGQRYDPYGILGDMFAEGSNRGVPKSATRVTVSQGLGYGAYDSVARPVYYIEVTLKDGTVVPCYSFTPAEEENGYMICQNRNFKAFRPAA